MDTRKLKRALTIGLSFMWMAFVYASFYLVQQQRPFTSVAVEATVSTLLDLLSASAVVLVSAAWGRRLCRWLGIELGDPGEGLVWGTGIGLGAFAVAVLAFGLLGWLTRWAMGLLLTALALVSVGEFAAVGRAVANVRSWLPPKWGPRVYLGAMVLMTLLVALTPPADWDGLFYHLALPRLYVAQGRIAPVTDVPHQHYPGLMEMLYLAVMLVQGDVAAKMIHLAYMFLLGAAVYLLAKRWLHRDLGWKALLVYASMPMVFVLGAWAYNDLALAFYQVAALYAFLGWLEDGSLRRLVPAAVFCGLAMGLKYTSFVCPLSLALLICWRALRERATVKRWSGALLLFGSVALLVATPWYVRNWVFTGNPVYPFAYSLFGGVDWDAWRGAWYARSGTGLGWDLAQVVRLPWMLTLGLRDMNFYDGRAGPLFLLSLPFAVAWGVRAFGRARPRPRAIGYLYSFALAQYAFWVLGVVYSRSLYQSRLLLPAFAVLCAPLAHLYEELRSLDSRVVSLQRLVGMSIVLVLAANLCYQFVYTVRIRPLPVLVGEESRAAFLRRNLGAYYDAMELVNDRVPTDGKVMFLWEPRSYYCDRTVQPDPILERWAWLYHRLGDEEAIALELNEQSYTHVLLFRGGLEQVLRAQLSPIGDAELDALEVFADVYLDEVATLGRAYELYALRPAQARTE